MRDYEQDAIKEQEHAAQRFKDLRHLIEWADSAPESLNIERETLLQTAKGHQVFVARVYRSARDMMDWHYEREPWMKRPQR